MERALGRMLLLSGLVLAAVGVALLLAPRIPWLGRLPGDFRFTRDGTSVFVPLASCIQISVLLTLFLNLFGKR
jgi:hypothetical protein